MSLAPGGTFRSWATSGDASTGPILRSWYVVSRAYLKMSSIEPRGPAKPSSRSRFVTKVPLPGRRIISCSRCRDERACLKVLRLTPNSRLRSPSPGSNTSGEYSPDRMRFRMTFSIWKYSGMLPRAMFGVLRSPLPAGGPARRTPRIRFLRAICSYVHTIEQMSCQAEILRSPNHIPICLRGFLAGRSIGEELDHRLKIVEQFSEQFGERGPAWLGAGTGLNGRHQDF